MDDRRVSIGWPAEPGDRLGKPYRLDLAAIALSLRALQKDFAAINRGLRPPRDPLTDEVLDNLLTGYRFVDQLVGEGRDLFAIGNSHLLLELNVRVLCGTEERRRAAFARHIAETRRRFYDQAGGGVRDLVEWLERHAHEDPWQRAAGAYIRLLGRPQLYPEGNHRTGALVMSYILAGERYPPFVLTVHNAKAYFEPSNLIRNLPKQSLRMSLRLPRLKTRFAAFLKHQAQTRYLIPAD
jgi:hypothetical protein